MSRKKMSTRETARIINDVATQIESGDRSLNIQLALNRAAEGLAPLKHTAGLTLLNRIGTQVLNIDATNHRYAIVAETMKALGPFESATAVSALRQLAEEISQLSVPPR
jgi:hypothetical protein